MLSPTPENFRSEMARHRLRRQDVAGLVGMNLNLYSMFINSIRPLPAWAAHNIAWGFNTVTGLAIFNVNMSHGPVAAPRGRPKSLIPRPPRKRRRRRYWRQRQAAAAASS